MANLKDIKKGDKVILRLFTGAFVAAKVVEMADANKIGFTSNGGVKMIFDKATGKQITPKPKKEQYASFLDDYDEETVKKETALKGNRKPKKAASKKATVNEAISDAKKKFKSQPIDDDDEFEEIE